MRYYRLTLLFLIVFCAPVLVNGQAFNPYQHAYQGWDGNKIKKASPLRAFLNKFSLNASLGYGRTFYSNIINSDILDNPESLVMLGDYDIANENITYTGIINWLNAPQIVNGEASLDQDSQYSVLYADSAEIRYAGSGWNVPFRLAVHYDIDRFRVGGGISHEMHGIRQLNPRGQGEYPYVPNFNATSMFRYFFMMGGKVYHLKGWDYYAEIEIGRVKYGNAYDKSMLTNGIYFNIGLPMEYEMSEYFWLFVRPSFDIKSYSMNITGSPGSQESVAFQFNQPAFYINLGVRMKMPEIGRCPVKACKTQLKHVHGGQEFRGQPFFKVQNPKIGQLYPELQQNKRKNRNGV